MNELREEMGYDGKREFLRKTLLSMGFRFKKCKSNRCILVEKSEIAAARRHYLRELRKHREDGNPVIYLDETYIHSTSVVGKCWQSENEKGILSSCSKGKRYIIVHAGGELGFIKGAGLVFKSGGKTDDYHGDMNNENFIKWLKEKLIPNLPHNSTVVMDNAAYHNTQCSKIPTSSTKKEDIILWLKNNNIAVNENYLKAELLQIVKNSRPKKEFIVDKLLHDNGHNVLRLPPYHPELNPIEMIWKQVKDIVKERNMFVLSEEQIFKLCHDAFNKIGEERWASCCQHVRELENKFWEEDCLIEDHIEDLIIHSSGFLSDDSDDYSETTETCDEVDM